MGVGVNGIVHLVIVSARLDMRNMKESFKAGDRIRVYGHNLIPSLDGIVLRDVFHDGFLNVRPDEQKDVVISAHSKQCRRLVKKERKEWWIIRWPEGDSDGTMYYEYKVEEYHEGLVMGKSGKENVEFFRVREVKKEK